MGFLKELNDYWAILAFIIGIIYKQILTHSDVRRLKEDRQDIWEKIEENETDLIQVRHELHKAIKEHGKETNDNIRRMTEIIGELTVNTRVIASELKNLKESRK